MEVTVLTVPHCPNAALMDERLATAVSGLAGVGVTRRVVGDEQQAAALGMRGSPTLLIGGTDPFADPGQPGQLVVPAVPPGRRLAGGRPASGGPAPGADSRTAGRRGLTSQAPTPARVLAGGLDANQQ